MRRIWTALEFPVLANELDRITWDNLVQLISEFETAFGETSLSAHEFSDLLTAAARRTTIQKSGVEDAGIQVLSRLDARGLCFRKIFIPGLVSGSFPQSVRSLPLLSSSERKKVLGGTIESQFSFARPHICEFPRRRSTNCSEPSRDFKRRSNLPPVAVLDRRGRKKDRPRNTLEAQASGDAAGAVGAAERSRGSGFRFDRRCARAFCLNRTGLISKYNHSLLPVGFRSANCNQRCSARPAIFSAMFLAWKRLSNSSRESNRWSAGREYPFDPGLFRFTCNRKTQRNRPEIRGFGRAFERNDNRGSCGPVSPMRYGKSNWSG